MCTFCFRHTTITVASLLLGLLPLASRTSHAQVAPTEPAASARSSLTLRLAQPPTPEQTRTPDSTSANGQTPVALPAPPAATELVAPQAADQQPCVLLRNDNVLFGSAEQLGQYVVVRTGEGGEVRLPRDQVACWADSVRDLYRYRVDHRQRGDISAHLHDARWCLRYELFDLAAEELRQIYRIDSNNRHAARIEQQLRRRFETRRSRSEADDPDTSASTAAHQVDATSTDQSGDVQPVQYESAEAAVDPMTLRSFASHIQPMMINRCGHCHGQTSVRPSLDVQWRLIKPALGARASAQMTRSNLVAVMQHVNTDEPMASEFWIKATAAHGGADAPLGIRNAKAIAALRQWLHLATAQPQHDSQPRNQSQNWSPSNDPVDDVTADVEDFQAIEQAAPMESADTPAPDQPSRLPQIGDPFDPDLFNRRFHMKTNGR